MKTTSKVFFILVIIIIFSSCFSPWEGDTGTFSISIGGSGSGRTILPWNEDIQIEALEHVITLEGPGPKQTASVTGAKTVNFSVVPGVWKISIEAYYYYVDDDWNERVAVGSRTVEIKPGSNGTIPIPMGKPSLFEMILVEGGSFQMGDAGYNYSSPVHTVTLSSFYIGKYEVTQEQYQTVMETNPSFYSTENGRAPDSGEEAYRRPVEQISWYDALVFCNKLSTLEGLSPAYSINGSTDPSEWGTVPTTTSSNTPWNAVVMVAGSNGYRLPTEAQWEYAAKGGQSASSPYKIYSGSDNVGDVAWHSGSKTHEVGKLSSNELGIYDMSGNVWEWCWDWYDENYYSSSPQTDPTGPLSGTYRVQRGGGFNDPLDLIRSAYRKGYYDPYLNLGFRVVLPDQPGTPGLDYVLINNGNAYRVSRGTATGNIFIPAYYNGKPVTTISNGTDAWGNGAFGGTQNNPNTSVTSITFARGSQLTTISSAAFFYCTNLTGINIPASVTSIGICAFQGSGLTSINIPAGVRSITEGAFYECTSLGSITIPASVTSIDTNAFFGCTSLVSVTFNGTIAGDQFNTSAFPGDLRAKYLAGGIGTYTTSNPGSSALWTKSMGEPPEEPGTPGLDFRLITTGNNKDTYCVYKGTVTGGSVVIPAAYNGRSVTEIGDEAFSGTILTSITIPTSVMSIGNYAFADCTELTSVTFKDGSQLTTIGNYAFRQCTGLANITIPESVTTIGEGAFVYCTSLGTITFAATSELLSIGSEAFSNCGLTNITIPESVTEIGAGAFFECNSLGSITIPEGVTFIGANTFGRCTSLAGVTIPESVESIGNWAFNGCTSLISVTFKGIITSDNFSSFNSFPGDLRDKYLENGGGIGTWTRDVNGSTPDVWTER